MDSRACVCTLISIHAPSRERPCAQQGTFRDRRISIHAPSRERLHTVPPLPVPFSKFQSTLPHGSDVHLLNSRSITATISIHAPSRERQPRRNGRSTSLGISIHAPSRERPCINTNRNYIGFISIHAPSRERPYFWRFISMLLCISIHAPSRERLCFLQQNVFPLTFQSTLPHGSDLRNQI